MAGGSSNIGSASVELRGDLAPLQRDLSKAKQVTDQAAKTAGTSFSEKLGSAISSGMQRIKIGGGSASSAAASGGGGEDASGSAFGAFGGFASKVLGAGVQIAAMVATMRGVNEIGQGMYDFYSGATQQDRMESDARRRALFSTKMGGQRIGMGKLFGAGDQYQRDLADLRSSRRGYNTFSLGTADWFYGREWDRQEADLAARRDAADQVQMHRLGRTEQYFQRMADSLRNLDRFRPR